MGKGQFDINTYVQNIENINVKRKARIFLNYIKENENEEVLSNPYIFSSLDKNYFLSSFEFYLNEFSPSRQSAGDYRRTMLNLCEKICEEYEMNNAFLESNSERQEFEEIIKRWIDELEEPNSRECISADSFEILVEKINETLGEEEFENKIIDSVLKVNSRPNTYGKLVSAIVLKLVYKFGLDNKTIANLKVSDLNIREKRLKVNGFNLPLDDVLMSNIQLYLKNRALVLEKRNIKTEYLFIKRQGTSYRDRNNYADNGGLFMLMDEVLGRKDATSLQYKAISEMAGKGVNLYLLHKLTGVDKGKIVNICRDEDEIPHAAFVNSSELRRKRKQKGLMQCSYCGRYVDACSENWILIQIEGQTKKYLACKECRGANGEYKY